jgi:cytoskeletal protein RodZ
LTFYRLQMVIATLAFGVIFIWLVVTRLAMPEFSGTLLAFMGISAGIYLGFKIPERQSSPEPEQSPPTTGEPEASTPTTGEPAVETSADSESPATGQADASPPPVPDESPETQSPPDESPSGNQRKFKL